MDHNIVIEDLGEDNDGAFFSAWLKDVGESVEKDEPIAEVMTDKVNVEIPAPTSGTLVSVDVEEEAPITEGQVIGVIRSED